MKRGLAYVLVSLVALASAQAQPSPLAAALRADLGRADDDPDVTCDDLKSEPAKWGLLILGSDPILAKAEAKAREISRKTGVPFSTEGYSLDPKTKRAKFVRAYEGDYEPRTSQCEGDAECITIERSSAYASLTPKLFIIVGAVLEEAAPESLSKYRASVPDAYVKFSTLKGDPGGYGATSSCMDWDMIVLARTTRLAEAEAIAKAVSQATGIRYADRTPKASIKDYYAERKEPYPNISVEADNAYSELGDSPYFLVIGGDFTAQLFERYKKVVPHAYRMKRARHVCGA